jgi:hypothetical protein
MEINRGCPMCGCEEIGKGRLGEEMFQTNKIISSGSRVLADICTECGHVLSLKVSNPGMFKNK